MKFRGQVLRFEAIGSTQTELAKLVRSGRDDVGAVLAYEQTEGRGRRENRWHSPRGECLAVSIALWDYKAFEHPELIGMAVAISAARAFDTHLQWPNDLVIQGKKVGGILGEVVSGVPIVGVGVNLLQTTFPNELRSFATSLVQEGRQAMNAEEALDALLREITLLPDPYDWNTIRSLWMERDATPGKRYTLADGREGIAQGIDENGHLVVDVAGENVIEPVAVAIR